MKVKLNRICDSFGAAKFSLPDDPSQIMNKVIEKDRELDENFSVRSLSD